MAVQPIEFNTSRLAFRIWQERHRAPFVDMNSDPEVMRYFPAVMTPEQTNARFNVLCQEFQERGWSNWAVELIETGEFIGFIGLTAP
jgi:RimJ/RimL family protein N-acetyltransferase